MALTDMVRNFAREVAFNATKRALVKTIENQEQRRNVIGSVVRAGTNTIYLNGGKPSEAGSKLTKFGLNQDIVDTVLSGAIDLGIGLASQFLINKINSVDIKDFEGNMKHE